MKFTIRALLVLTALTAPVTAQRMFREQLQPVQQLQQQQPVQQSHKQPVLHKQEQEPVMIDGAVNATDVNVGEEAMIQSVVPPAASSSPSMAPRPATAAPSMPAKPILPITATMYSGSPGPKDCRGTPILRVNLPKGPGIDTPKGPTCYNIQATPHMAQCGTFTANQEDGCQAKLFSDPGCTNFANLAVFGDELRPMGGMFQSVEIVCGIVSEQPGPLNLNLPKVQKPAGKSGR